MFLGLMIDQPSLWPSPTPGRGNTLPDTTDNFHVTDSLTAAVARHIPMLAQDSYETSETAVYRYRFSQGSCNKQERADCKTDTDPVF